MTTVRQIERLWTSQQFPQLLAALLHGRPESATTLRTATRSPLPVAAIILIRLDELSQSHVPLYARLVKFLLAAQEPDGGWTDPLTTALCLRALLAGGGSGDAIDRGIGYLASLQKPDGLWPLEPLRRMPADATVSAFILLQLGGHRRFVEAIRFDQVLKWFQSRDGTLDPTVQQLWEHASLRCRLHGLGAADAQTELSWS